MTGFLEWDNAIVGLGAVGGLLTLVGCVCFVQTSFLWIRECYVDSHGVRTVARVQDKFVSVQGKEDETIERREVSLQYITVDTHGEKYFGQKTFKFLTIQAYEEIEIDTATPIIYSRDDVQRDPSWEFARSQTMNRILRVIIGVGLLAANHGVVTTRGGWTVYYILFDILFGLIYFGLIFGGYKCVSKRFFKHPPLKPSVRCVPLRDMDRIDLDEFLDVMKKNGWILRDDGSFEQSSKGTMLVDVDNTSPRVVKTMSSDAVADQSREI